MKMTAETAKVGSKSDTGREKGESDNWPQFNEQRSTQGLQSARTEILGLSRSVADVEERFGKYRAEKVGVSSLGCHRVAINGGKEANETLSNPSCHNSKSNTIPSFPA